MLMMKRINYLLLSAVILCGHFASAKVNRLQLLGPKDLVLPIQDRAFVLETAKEYLHPKSESFEVAIEGVQSPYLIQGKEEAIMADNSERVATDSGDPLVYDDLSVLKVVAANFGKQVRGTLARGSSYYLQLVGGSLSKAGDQFIVKIPEVKEQEFIVTILKIDSLGYTLMLGDVTLDVPLSLSTGVIKESPS